MKFFFVLFAVFFSHLSMAGNGIALIPNWNVSAQTGAFDISNITDNPIDVKIKLYSKDGSIVDLSKYEAESSFTIQPKASKRLTLRQTNSYVGFDFGFGYISWSNQTSEQDDSVALIAHYSTRTDGKTPINQGRPF